MEFEFDKEIDALLRQTAQGETALASANHESRITNHESNHLDADALAAFAENALPEKTRLVYLSHLADCDHCRKILSNSVALNPESASEIIHREASPSAAAMAAEIPWYRKFFAVPTLAYAMGALILLFAGIGVFTILQNDSKNSQVSQITEKQIGGKGMSSDGNATAPENYNQSISNAAATNSAALTNTTSNAANSAAATATEFSANSNAAIMRRDSNQSLREDTPEKRAIGQPSKPNEPSSVAAGSALPAAPPPPQTSNDFQLDGQQNAPPQSQAPVQTAKNEAQITPDARKDRRAPAAPSVRLQKQEVKEADESTTNDSKGKSAETTRVAGKTFTRNGNLWIDAAYRGQATTNISRGTKEYINLDAGLRGIVENLGGTVVIVWKEKAYRIQ